MINHTYFSQALQIWSLGGFKYLKVSDSKMVPVIKKTGFSEIFWFSRIFDRFFSPSSSLHTWKLQAVLVLRQRSKDTSRLQFPSQNTISRTWKVMLSARLHLTEHFKYWEISPRLPRRKKPGRYKDHGSPWTLNRDFLKVPKQRCFRISIQGLEDSKILVPRQPHVLKTRAR